MKATDGILLELARKARVKPPHIWHVYSYRSAIKGAFSIEGYSAFAQMEQAHVARMVEVLDAYEAGVKKPQRKSGLTTMPADYILPEASRLWAQTEKGWTRDIADTQASKFVDYWHSRGTQRADWLACWRNWVRSDYSPAGVISAGAQERWTDAEQKAYLERMKL